MTAVLVTQISFQQSMTPIRIAKDYQQEIHPNSDRTTRSGTPEARDSNSEFHDHFQSGTPLKERGSPTTESNVEIGVKPKKKQFKDQVERKRFVENFKKKIKTELCKNFELRGWCKFGSNCSFAHGKHELQEKLHLHSKYKTKPCQQFHLHGHCNYGQRCQYLHTEALMPNIFYEPCSEVYVNSERTNYSYELLSEIFKLASTDSKVEKILNKIPKRTRLPIFEEFAYNELTNDDVISLFFFLKFFLQLDRMLEVWV